MKTNTQYPCTRVCILLLALALTFSCSSDDPSDDDSIDGDSIDYCGETYKIVVIGTQTWVSRNLNCNVSGSVCYDDNEDNCDKYGRLYDWETAMSACPDGWHLPTNEDWDELYRFVDGSSETDSPYMSETAGEYLKTTSGWDKNGLDTYGFSALPGGNGFSDGSFSSVGGNGYWWSASEYSASKAYMRFMLYHNTIAYYDYYDKIYLFSVRCIKD